MTIQFGTKYRDKITGFEGVATGECRYISGCDQALLAPKTKGGEFKEPRWFDVQRLEPCVSKRVKVDNRKTPGADIPAPIR